MTTVDINSIPKLPPPWIARAFSGAMAWLASIRRRMLVPQIALFELGTGIWPAMCLHAMAKLGVADRLKNEPASAEDLAAALGLHGPSLYRVLRFLAGIDVFTEDSNGRFRLTRIGNALVNGVPGSAAPMLRYVGESWQLAPWSNIISTLRDGTSSFERMYGEPFFTYCAKHPDVAETFDDAMTSVVQLYASAVLGAYDFSGIQSLVDVGGGKGVLLSAILAAKPAMHGVLFDMPHVVENGRAQLQAAGVADRCEIVGGNFFDAVPAGHDAYLMGHILHDWDDDRAQQILRACRTAMPRTAKVLAVDCVLPEADNRFYQGKLTDLQMMLFLSGKERTKAEFQTLFARAGLSICRIVPTAAPECVIEAVKTSA